MFTFKGKLFLDTAFRITLHDLESKQSISNNFFLSSIPADRLKETTFYNQFDRFDDDFIKISNKAMEESFQFIFVLEHCKKSLEFPFEDEVTNYDYMKKIIEKFGKTFKNCSSQVEELVNQCKRNDIPYLEAIKNFQDYFSALTTEEGKTTFEISSSKLEEVIELMGNLIVAVLDTILLYIKNRYDD
ncbi:MAG: hypothetical protein KAW12_13630 [Candidatus Aminicenantes bacterium]|nr:hypothetical protein [Candidatus Aminicenantes bacterium]